jgi:arylsulfatase A-like enzyme
VLAGWLGFAYLASIVLATATVMSTHYVAARTEFRPMIVGFVMPIFTVATALGLLATSRPAARGIAHVARALDRRWRARGRTTLLSPLRVIAALAVLALATVLGGWAWVSPRLGHLDTSPVRGPLVGAVVVVIAHRVARGRRWLGWGATVAAVGAMAAAVYAWRVRPTVMLAVWGELPVTGVVVDVAFDLDEVRDQVSLDAFRPSTTPGALHPDIIVITIDTVRADRTPPYGGPAEMPFLQKLAERGAVFEWAFAPSNVTRRSIPSMMTGIQPNRVRGRVVGWALRIDPRHVMVAERLRAAGYDTAGFMCCEGFWGPAARTGLSRGLEHLEIERNGTLLAERARAWLERREKASTKRPLFLWMHILEPHNWSNGGSEPADLELRRRMYDRSLTASDRMLAQVVGAFAKRAPDAAPIVIVSADHGEALGDHGEPNHSTDLYNSQLRVPFVVVGPGIRAGRIDESVSLTDLGATLVELAGFAPPVTDGRSLAPLLTGARAPDEAQGLAYAAMIKDRSNPGGVTALVVGRWKLIVNGDREELYDLKADPGELVDLAAKQPAKVAELRARLAARENLAQSPFQ